MHRALALALFCAACRHAAQAPSNLDEVRTLVVGGRDRTYRLFVPRSVDRTRPAALVIVLHGGLMTFDRIVEGTRFSDEALRSGFMVAYLKAEPGVFFNSGDANLLAPGLPPRRRIDPDVDDVEFVRAVIASVGAENALDRTRIFATGISNGGSMAHRLGCELSDAIAAIAPVAGELMVECRPVKPVSVMEFHGLEDPIFPYQGGVGNWAAPTLRSRRPWRGGESSMAAPGPPAPAAQGPKSSSSALLDRAVMIGQRARQRQSGLSSPLIRGAEPTRRSTSIAARSGRPVGWDSAGCPIVGPRERARSCRAGAAWLPAPA